MAANMPALEAPASISMINGFLPRQVILFIKEHSLRLFGRSAAATLQEALIKQAMEVVYTPTKTKVIIENDVVVISSPATDSAYAIALEQPSLSLTHPAFAILCAVAIIAAITFVWRARAQNKSSHHTAALEQELEDTSAAIVEQRDALVNYCTSKDAKIVKLKSKIVKQTAGIASAVSTASAVKETLECLQQEQARIAGDVELREATAQNIAVEKDEKISDLKAQIVNFNTQVAELSNLRKHKRSSSKTITSLEAAATATRQENEKKQSTLQNELDNARDKNAALETDARKIGEEAGEMRAAQKSANKQISDLLSNKETDLIANEKKQLATEQAAAIKIEALEEKLRKASESAEKLESAVEKAEEAKIALSSANKELATGNATLKTARANQTTRIIGITKEKGELETALKTLQDRQDVLASAHSQLLSRSNLMEDQNTAMQSRVEELEQQIKELESEIEEQQDDTNASQADDDARASTSSANLPPPPPPAPSGASGDDSQQQVFPENSNADDGSADEQKEGREEPEETEENDEDEEEEEDDEDDQEKKVDSVIGETGSGSTGDMDGTAGDELARPKRPKQRGRKKRDRDRKNTGAHRTFKRNAAAAAAAAAADSTMTTAPVQQALSGSALPVSAGPARPIPTGPAQRTPTGPAYAPFARPAPFIPTGPAQGNGTVPARPIPTGPAQSSFLRPAQPILGNAARFIPTGPAQMGGTGPARATPTGPARPIPTGPARQTPTGPARPIPTGPAIPSTGPARPKPTRRGGSRPSGQASSYNIPARQESGTGTGTGTGTGIWGSRHAAPPQSDMQR